MIQPRQTLCWAGTSSPANTFCRRWERCSWKVDLTLIPHHTLVHDYSEETTSIRMGYPLSFTGSTLESNRRGVDSVRSHIPTDESASTRKYRVLGVYSNIVSQEFQYDAFHFWSGHGCYHPITPYASTRIYPRVMLVLWCYMKECSVH